VLPALLVVSTAEAVHGVGLIFKANRGFTEWRQDGKEMY
jgi:hypothetical protein